MNLCSEIIRYWYTLRWSPRLFGFGIYPVDNILYKIADSVS